MLKVIPIAYKTANKFVVDYHRHHKEVQGQKFVVGIEYENKLCGVAICGRPVSRHLDNGLTIEITRLCTDGTKNACSKLYNTCARISKEFGYEKIITYILNSEQGTSLKAAGWKLEGKDKGGKEWKRNDGYRTNKITTLFGEEMKYPSELKQLWSKQLN